MTIYRSLLLLNCFCFLLVALLVVFNKFSGWQVSDLFFFPFFSPNPNVALLTRSFQLLCSVPFVVCAFTSGLANSLHPRHPANRFILFSAILTGAFLLNEIYRIHIYMLAWGIPKALVGLVYAVGFFCYGCFFRRELKLTPYPILLMGLGLLFLGIGIDALNIQHKTLASLLEGIPKLFSEINIAFYYWYVCKSFVEKSAIGQLRVDSRKLKVDSSAIVPDRDRFIGC